MSRKRTTADLEQESYRVHTVKTLVHMTKREEAAQLLQKLINHTRQLMQRKKWKVTLLCEFYPKNKRLLGLNVNRGYRIMIRLRCPNDQNTFLPYESLLGTMLHELTHIVISPHNSDFYAMVDALEVEVQKDFVSSNYKEVSYVFEQTTGNRLGGGSSSSLSSFQQRQLSTTSSGTLIPQKELLRQAREKKLTVLSSGIMSGGARTLGGNLSSKSSLPTRELQLQAIERRRARDNATCIDIEDDEEDDKDNKQDNKRQGGKKKEEIIEKERKRKEKEQRETEIEEYILQNTQEIAIINLVDEDEENGDDQIFSSSSFSVKEEIPPDLTQFCQPCEKVNPIKISVSSSSSSGLVSQSNDINEDVLIKNTQSLPSENNNSSNSAGFLSSSVLEPKISVPTVIPRKAAGLSLIKTEQKKEQLEKFDKGNENDNFEIWNCSICLEENLLMNSICTFCGNNQQESMKCWSSSSISFRSRTNDVVIEIE
jgi:hypothetical protein